jgi:hypothetical protein
VSGELETLKRHFEILGISLSEITPSETKGYWKLKQPCPGGDGCRHAFRGYIGACDGGGALTVSFINPGRDAKGRLLSPYRFWKAHRDHLAKEQQPTDEKAGKEGV